MAQKLSQKEYLKKYLYNEKKVKSKKSKTKPRVKIIDDDIDIVKNEVNDELILTGEDAPQIVGIIDEQLSLRSAEDYRNSGKWKTVSDQIAGKMNEYENANTSRFQKVKYDSSDDLTPKRKANNSKHKNKNDIKISNSPSKKKYDSSEDISPKRKKRQNNDHDSDDDLAPRRKKDMENEYKTKDSSISSKKYNSSEDMSPKRRRISRDSSEEYKRGSGKKDIGKSRSIVNTRLKDKYLESVKREKRSRTPDIEPKTLSVRESRHRRDRNLNRDPVQNEKNMKREEEKQKIYSRWGKGLKQIEDYKTKFSEQQYEMNKPLARYSDDADLEEILKKQIRAGDPMLEYIEKKNENKKSSNILEMPVYKGSFPENRFNIRPGYRWDGVDRSNGYENKWFTVYNRKKAIQEEAYKYSAEDL